MQALHRQSRRALSRVCETGGLSNELLEACSKLGFCSSARAATRSTDASRTYLRQALACALIPSEQAPCSAILVQQRRAFRSSTTCMEEARRKSAEEDIVYREEEFSSLTDRIPVRPVSAPEAAGWSVFILAAYAITAALAYFVVTQLFMQQPEVAAFNAALDKVRQDPRITVQLGETIKGYGTEGNRASRHRISHRIYSDSNGQQHVQVQFHIAGNGQRGIVSADMHQRGSEWLFSYLYVEVSGRRVVLVEPHFSD